MFADIGIAIVGFLAQCAITWIAWRATVSPITPEDKKRQRKYEGVIVIAFIVGLIVLIVAGVRGGDIRAQLEAIQTGQHKTEAGIEGIEHNTRQAPVINLPQIAEHTHVEYLSVPDASRLLGISELRLIPGEKPTIPIAFKNAGAFAVQQPTDSVLLTLISSAKYKSAFRDLRKTFVSSAGPSGSIPAGSSQGGYHTAVGPLLNDSDLAKLKGGDLFLCGFGAVRWLDKTGTYETHFAQCLEVEPDHQSFNWHQAKENNEEQKIK